MPVRLGLDLGTNSIGWWRVETDKDGRPVKSLGGGVRIYADGRNPKDKTSLAVQRRVPRGARRRRDRYLKRRSRLMDLLIGLGLMPEGSTERKALETADPYGLRAAALERPLKTHELGRALFHLNQRRGFKSNRKADTTDETGPTREEIRGLKDKIAKSGAKTLGAYLHMRREKGKAVRAREGEHLYPDRDLYKQEFAAIREAQAPHHRLSANDWDRLEDVIFFQRRLRPVDPGVCTFFPEEKRMARAYPLAQRFRILQEVANLEVHPPNESRRALTRDERDILLKKLFAGTDVKFASLPKLLDLDQRTGINLEDEKRKDIKGDETARKLKHKYLFGKRWLDISFDRQSEIVADLLQTEEPETIIAKAAGEWGLESEAARKLATAALPDGYMSLGQTAISKLVPVMADQGLRYAEAVEEAGLGSHSDIGELWELETLPYYGAALPRHVVGAQSDVDLTGRTADEIRRYGRIANPTVHIGLNQIRRMVNQIIRLHGRPDEIVVELARDLKQNRKEKQRERIRQAKEQKANERLSEDIRKAGGVPTPVLLRKLRLWEEQGPPQARVCPYSGKVISFRMALSEATDIDHILPFSRTLDNSMANKIVCLREANRDKKNRTPFEAFGPGANRNYDYETILHCADRLPVNKRWRLYPDAMERFADEDRFLDRQLNETRYLSRIAGEYLRTLYPRECKHLVRVVPGRLTALLRRQWGLGDAIPTHNLETPDPEKPGPKVRLDHRHHAVDAFVVACTTRAVIRKVQDAARETEENERTGHRLIARLPLPWPGFSHEAFKTEIARMVVAHRPSHDRSAPGSTTGALHNDTAYGIVERHPDGKTTVVSRKPLAMLKEVLSGVRDVGLRALLEQAWYEAKAAGKTWAEFAETMRREQGIRRVRIIERLGNIVEIQGRNGVPYKAYKADGNAYMDIVRLPDGKWRGETVSRFHAHQPGFIPHWKRDYPAAPKLFRLFINDMVAVGNGAGRRVLRVVKLSGRTVTMAEHNAAGNLKSRSADKNDPFKYLEKSAGALRDMGFRKIGVDPLGRLTDPGPKQA